jgi:transposase-like protein
MENREIRAYSILAKGDMPTAISSEEFMMPSQTDKDKRYRVQHKEAWVCDCLDFQKHHKPCKHIIATQLWLKMRAKAQNEGTFDIEKEVLNKLSCAYCGSDNVFKNGSRKTQGKVKQRFFCRDCKRTFIEDKGFEKFKGEPKLITLIMDLYFKGVSLRKIKDHVKQFYGKDISHETLRRWIVRFTKKLNENVDKFTPKLSDTWHADEVFVKTRTSKQTPRGNWAYNWNVLDSKTRFLIASNITELREQYEAKQTFREAKRVANTEPKTIITDNWKAYDDAVKEVLPNTEHHKYAGLKAHVQNNKIERFHGTFRERDKVMRGLKSIQTAQNFIDAHRAYYNFIRPHSALGMTPAQAAGIDLNLGQNRWLSLLRN